MREELKKVLTGIKLYDRLKGRKSGGELIRQDRDKLKQTSVNKSIGAIFMPGQVILPPKTISVLLVGHFYLG